MYFAGSVDSYGVYGFIRDLILEGKVAKWVNHSGRYVVLDWSRALDRYADYKAKKNPLFKRTNQSRRNASNRLRAALLNAHKKDGAKEYMESKKVNEKDQVVQRQFQMPPRVFESLFRNTELSDSSEEQDEQEKKRLHLSEVSWQTGQGYDLILYWLKLLLCKSGTFLTKQHEPILNSNESCNVLIMVGRVDKRKEEAQRQIVH